MGKVCWVATAVALFIIGAALLTAGLVVDLSVFNSIVHSSMKSQKVLGLNDDGTYNDFTKEWANPNYISTMNYWTFDYKNTIGVMNRAMYPDMIEKGPYVYKETLINTNIGFSADGNTMTFSQATQYNFDPVASCSGCDPYKDTVTVPDISFVLAMNAIEAVLHQLENSETFYNECMHLLNNTILNNQAVCGKIEGLREKTLHLIEREMGVIMDLFGISPFVTVTVDQLINSGYQVPLVSEMLNKVIGVIDTSLGGNVTVIQPLPSNITVALNPANGTTNFLYVVDTGKQDYQKSGFTLSFTNTTMDGASTVNGSLPLAWWSSAASNTSSCSLDNGEKALNLEGTNADYFQSFISKTDTLPIYVENLCRSVRLSYDREVTVKGIDGYRFVLPSSEFDYTLPDNCGYCNPLQYGAYNLDAGSPCMPTGLLDISQCQPGFPKPPILMSKPHFYQADSRVTSFVPRFRPTYDNDETTLDIEPITGTVLAAKKKLQINMFMNQWPHIPAYSVIRPGAYPLLWLNESFLIDKGTVDQLNGQLFTPKKIIQIICWTAVGVGGALMVLSVVILFVQFCVNPKAEKKDQ